MKLGLAILLLLSATSILPFGETGEEGAWRATERPFRVVSGSMRPTLNPGDGVVARQVEGSAVRRGDLIAFHVGAPRQIWMMRVIGLPGDQVAMRAGIVILNGAPVPQREIGAGPVIAHSGTKRESRLIEERVSDEGPAYHVLDLGPARLDDTPAVRVPTGHVFVLGDNRDDAADSRVSRPYGAGMVPMADVYGIVDRIMPGAYPMPPQPRPSQTPPVAIVPDPRVQD